MPEKLSASEQTKEIIREVRGRDIDESFRVKDKIGRDIDFSNADTQTIFKMRLCTVSVQLNILGISNYELRCHLEGYRKGLITHAIDLLGRKWEDREWGEDFVFNEHCVPSVPVGCIEVLKALKVKKCKLSDEQIEDVINFFTGERSEVKEKGV